MEKYGFVYIWRDRKHKRYYIGCHWGHVDDGYICSSTWMRNAFRKRPLDFKRRIISIIRSSRKELFEEEYVWLSMINPHEMRVKYYNLSIKPPYHWSVDDVKSSQIRNDHSKLMKLKYQDPEFKQKMQDVQLSKNLDYITKELIERKRQSMKRAMADKYPIEHRQQNTQKRSDRFYEKRKSDPERLEHYRKWARENAQKRRLLKKGMKEVID